MELTTPNSLVKSQGEITTVTAKRTPKPRRKRIEAPHISELCEVMIAKFGGVETFCKDWHEQIQEAIDKAPGSQKVLDAYGRIANLVEASTKMRLTAPDVFDMSDEELEEEIQFQVVKVMQSKQDTKLLEHDEHDEPI